ncbi:unnamed protein product [Merluccius merluccius]
MPVGFDKLRCALARSRSFWDAHGGEKADGENTTTLTCSRPALAAQMPGGAGPQTFQELQNPPVPCWNLKASLSVGFAAGRLPVLSF